MHLESQLKIMALELALTFLFWSICRLHNMGAPVTTVLGTVFRGADLESQLNVLARRAGVALPTTSLADTTKRVTASTLSDSKSRVSS